jgi:signal transduction histidine kinase
VTDSRGQVSRLTVWGQEDPTLVRLRNLIAPVTGVGALLLTLMVLAWLIGRSILRPLAAMSRAARLIAAGDLAFQLPDSHVREVAEVGAAFRVMGEALGESIQRQALLEQERRLFISAIVHDLRTPLFSLRGYLAGLAEGVANTPEKSERYVAVCQDKVAALDRLVSDLFAYAQIEYLEQEPERNVLDLGELLTRMVEELQPLARAKGIKLFVSGPTERGLVDGDEHLLTRAIENLLDNALRHTPPEGSVEVSWRRVGPHLEFTVGDSGPGFALGDLPHVFAPLYRAETSRNRRTGGAGLGLTIARRIMLAHGGDLTAANDPSGGAILTGTLPASRAPRDRAQPDGSPPTERPLVANVVVTSTASPLRPIRRDA